MFIAGAAIPPDDDVPADHADLLLLAGLVGAVELELAQGRELGIRSDHDAFAGYMSDLDVARRGPGSGPGCLWPCAAAG